VSDFENLDYYELLGVPRSASIDEIKRAYRREISKYHPDRFVNGTIEEHTYAQQRSQRLTEAYSVLSDFAARSAYNRGQTPTGNRNRPPRPATPTAQPRDHQSELYDQAQRHLAAGRLLQAIGALRQLQQINPFYRDSADLLASAEKQLNGRQERSTSRIRRPLVVAGGVGGIALAALAAWAIGMRGATASRNPGGTSIAAALVATRQPTEAMPPTFTLAPSTQVPTVEVEPSAIPPTAVPTDLPTEPPTVAPSPTPIDFPTVTPTPLPTAAPAQAGEPGKLLFADDFGQAGWADIRGPGWQVGYQGQRYRIAANQGLGAIWSYRSASVKDYSMGVDLQVTNGEAGLLLRFLDANNYLSVSLNPSQTSFRVEQHDAGATNVIAGGQSEAVQVGAGAINRLVVRLSGNHLQILANGQPLTEVDAPGVPNSTRYGLLVLTNDSSVEAFFDNLEIHELGGS
jgi:hypothetical protein